MFNSRALDSDCPNMARSTFTSQMRFLRHRSCDAEDTSVNIVFQHCVRSFKSIALISLIIKSQHSKLYKELIPSQCLILKQSEAHESNTSDWLLGGCHNEYCIQGKKLNVCWVWDCFIISTSLLIYILSLIFTRQFGFRWRVENEVVCGKGKPDPMLFLVLCLA